MIQLDKLQRNVGCIRFPIRFLYGELFYLSVFIHCLLEFLQVQANRAYVKEIQVNQVSCASDLWSIKYLSSQDNSGMYSIRHNDGSCVTGSIQVSGTNKKEARLLDSDFFQGKVYSTYKLLHKGITLNDK